MLFKSYSADTFVKGHMIHAIEIKLVNAKRVSVEWKEQLENLSQVCSQEITIKDQVRSHHARFPSLK